MGISDALQATAANLQQRGSPDLQPVKDACWRVCGLCSTAAGAVGTAVTGEAARAGQLVHSAADSLRRSAPDLAPVASAASRVDRAIRVEGPQRIKEAVGHRAGWERIGRIAWNLTDHALGEASKPYTGGFPVYRIVKEGWAKGQSRPPLPAVSAKEEEEEALRSRMERLEARLERMEAAGSGPPLYSHLPRMVGGAQQPQDVLRVFMMKGFKGADFIDAQAVPQNAGKTRTTP